MFNIKHQLVILRSTECRCNTSYFSALNRQPQELIIIGTCHTNDKTLKQYITFTKHLNTMH